MKITPKPVLEFIQVFFLVFFIEKTFQLIVFIKLLLEKAGNENTKVASRDIEMNFDQLYKISKQDYYISSFLLIIYLSSLLFIMYKSSFIFKKINFEKPFESEISKKLIFISKFLAVASVYALIFNIYLQFRVEEFLKVKALFFRKELLYIACIVYVLGKIFERGEILQSENELTI